MFGGWLCLRMDVFGGGCIWGVGVFGLVGKLRIWLLVMGERIQLGWKNEIHIMGLKCQKKLESPPSLPGPPAGPGLPEGPALPVAPVAPGPPLKPWPPLVPGLPAGPGAPLGPGNEVCLLLAFCLWFVV